MHKATAKLLAIDCSAQFLAGDGWGTGPRQRKLRIDLSVLPYDCRMATRHNFQPILRPHHNTDKNKVNGGGQTDKIPFQRGNVGETNLIRKCDNYIDKHRDYINSSQTIEYAHTLENQIQGQIDAGFVISGFYEDDFGGTRILDKHIKTFIATRAIKLKVD